MSISIDSASLAFFIANVTSGVITGVEADATAAIPRLEGSFLCRQA
jgi:hypothetical protein